MPGDTPTPRLSLLLCVMEGGARALQNSAHTPQVPLARTFPIYFCRGRKRKKNTAEPRENPEELPGPAAVVQIRKQAQRATSPRPPEGQVSAAAGPPGSPGSPRLRRHPCARGCSLSLAVTMATVPRGCRPRLLLRPPAGFLRRVGSGDPGPGGGGPGGRRPRAAPERGTSLREAAAGPRPHSADLASGTGPASRPFPEDARRPPAGRASVSSPGKWAPAPETPCGREARAGRAAPRDPQPRPPRAECPWSPLAFLSCPCHMGAIPRGVGRSQEP